jgi:hypothetical protein
MYRVGVLCNLYKKKDVNKNEVHRYISVFIYAFVCANTLGAIVLKPRFKIDVVIMII